MSPIWRLALRYTLHHRVLCLVLAACIGLSLLLPAATALLIDRYSRDLMARSASTPLVAGPKGNRSDLTLAALYWRPSSAPTLSLAQHRTLVEDKVAELGIAVPLHVRFTTRRVPLVATTPEYFAMRGLHAAAGTMPVIVGEVAVGSRAASRLNVRPGDELFSDQIDAFDISRPAALKLHVVGVLERTGSPDDDAAFTDLKTAWILEGLAHSHTEAPNVPERLVLERSARGVTLSEEFIEHNEITDATRAGFHLHAGESQLPITATLIFPADAKGATLIKARLATAADVQPVVPREVIEEMLSIVVRVRSILDAIFVVLAASTGALVTLVVTLSVQVRAREAETLHRIGCSRWFVVKLHVAEFVIVFGAGAVAALAGVAMLVGLSPSLVRLLEMS